MRAFLRFDFWRENTSAGATFDIKVNTLSINIAWSDSEEIDDDMDPQSELKLIVETVLEYSSASL